MEEFFTVFLLCFSLLHDTAVSTTIESISTMQSLDDGDTMVSAGGTFALGFFNSKEDSMKRYLGIWYKEVVPITVVWVANRNNPLNDSSGLLKITDKGLLVLLNNNNSIFWSSNSSSNLIQQPVALLLDTGNLIVNSNKESGYILWQSFDYPFDTLLPGMKLGSDLTTGLSRNLTSWSSPDDPSKGNYTFQLDIVGYPQLCIRSGELKTFCSGSWNGIRFNGIPHLKPNPIFKYYFVSNKKEMYYGFELINSSVFSRLVITSDGTIQRSNWRDNNQGWINYLSSPTDSCDYYAKCGVYGSCNIDNSIQCGCLKGFEPKFPEEWNQLDWTKGCVRRTPLSCHEDGFERISSLKLPDTERSSWLNVSLSLDECAKICKSNCSCMAYAALDIRKEASGCLLWYGELINIRVLSDPQQDLYVRMSKKDSGNMRRNPEEHEEEELELPLFDRATLNSATSNFSTDNILGTGGFGTVYKGILERGEEIAVKRLSENSRQGLKEFKTEVMHIAKLQHRNLVKLLGCCIQVEERMLVYEFMPNKSLDHFIFVIDGSYELLKLIRISVQTYFSSKTDGEKGILLDWPKRFLIINGIARGLLYLHQDSRHRVVHRDLKAGNILLDIEMNPKISDFGLARSIVGTENEATTNYVVGTYGYMAPEYIIDGQFSTKSDVYSFGVLVLEIVSGRRNRAFRHRDHHYSLLGHAWTFFNEDKWLTIVDGCMRDSINLPEVKRSIQVGLLCVQRNPEDRPSMSEVQMMLSSECALPRPEKPGFFTERDLVGQSSSSSNNKGLSITQLSVTEVHPR
ncbi:hypothetical protein PIB30_003504 [Stylosanthes scabra]|uniref:Receptor-like serine/threonine-protein kinase n=1 Tax=Stylosanthes scabra TaxID=79078 RepID=A0ABU6V3N3_9FABA|nr:hypothetical protein [Stylosanthes scabra]